MNFKPMLACRDKPDLDKLTYPVYASPKLDGIRCCIVEGQALSRSLKPIANLHIRQALSCLETNGFDGELIVGSPTASDVYNKTESLVMSKNKEPEDVTFLVFDCFAGHPEAWAAARFEDRHAHLKALACSREWPRLASIKVEMHAQALLYNSDQVREYAERMAREGYEGVILRSPSSPYKFGRSTMKEGYLLKLKQRERAEARIIGCKERMHNANETFRDNLGRTARSSAAEGKSGLGTMGALVCMTENNVEFSVGGFTANEAARLWSIRESLPGCLCAYDHMPYGAKEAPREPTYKGLRHADDL